MKNKFTTYLLYAIGEITLVVFGILIAVQIDTWNKSKNDRKKELSYLTSYAIDLKENIKELERVILKSSHMSNTADSLIAILSVSEGALQQPTLDTLIQGLIGYTKYLSQEGTTENLLGTGSLEIIRNQDIRSSFVTQEADQKRLRAVERYIFNAFNEYMDYLKRNTKIYNGQLGKSVLNGEIAAFLSNNRYFLNTLDDLSATFKEVNELYTVRKIELAALLEDVESEIQKLN